EESLQRTLALAQKFVDQTQAEAEAQAHALLSEAEQRARSMVAEADEKAKTTADEAERRIRQDVARLEALRTQLAGDVETIARHLEAERTRLRGALGEMLRWVDEHVQPAAALLAPQSAERTGEGVTQRQGLMPVGQGQNAPNGTSR
ncbi:MAG: DivIVA domain-containing protein, partial [Acidimicrobiales bacterium]